MPRYIYPPHPSSAMKIIHTALDNYERQGKWVAQLKYQGSRVSVKVCPDDVEAWNRHHETFTTYKITPRMKECFRNLNLDAKKEYWLDGELLHTKAKSAVTGQQAVTNTIVLFDVLYADDWLQDDQMARLKMLDEICKRPTTMEKGGRALLVQEVGESQVWMAQTWENNFSEHFYEFLEFDKNNNDLHPEIEGLVLRNKKFRLRVGDKPYDTDGIIRCRKPKPKMYLF